MRQALNGNPVAQMAAIGVLALVAGFFFLRTMGGPSAGEEAAPAATEPPAAAVAPASDAASSDVAAASDPAGGAVPAAAPASGAGDFVAGPGLPQPVAQAYDDGRTVVLLVTRHGGIDDRQVRLAVSALRSRPGIAVFASAVKHTARYSRITEGVSLDRVPALIVLSPRRASDGPMPTASVSYGYRGLESVEQAVRDAGYKGPKLPYHPR